MTEFIVWPAGGDPVMFRDAASVARWAQARGVPHLNLWWLDSSTRTIRSAYVTAAVRGTLGDRWELFTEGRLIAVIPADSSSDPRVLAVVDYIETSTAEADGRLVARRYDHVDWPPAVRARDIPRGSSIDVTGDVPTWHYCPAIIAAAAAHLDETDLRTYLHGLDMRASQCITHRDLSDDDLERRVDMTLHDTFGPEAARLFMDVELRALDRSQPAPPDRR